MAKITQTEIKTASTGNSYKQCTVDVGIGDKNRFNIFNDHPKYAKCEVGVEIPQELLFINQRGYLELKNEQAKKSGAQLAEMAIKDHFDRRFNALQADLKIIADHLGVEPPVEKIGNTGVDYPTSETSTGDGSTPEINPEDIPF